MAIKKLTKVELLENKLDSIDIGGELKKEVIIKELWGVPSDYYIRRSFDVALHNAKKSLPNKIFKSSDKDVIIRVS